MALDKLEGRLRRLADRRKVHHGKACPPSVAEITATIPDAGGLEHRAPKPARKESDSYEEVDSYEEPARDEKLDDDIVPIEMDGEGPLIVREKFHKAEPMTIDQALLEMELVGHDFYLFRDKESGLPSVVYNRRGYNYGVLRLVEP
jgi:hypothetical protein